jgi:hypothetical protein
MSCAEHDRYAAGSQFITHTIGRSATLHISGTFLQLSLQIVFDLPA